MITDNLAPLFDQGPSGARIRQGTILTWNAETGANTVDLAGGTLVNVPILNTGEAIALKAGHVVGLLGQGSTWFILGRVTVPGDPQFASASVAFDTLLESAGNFSVGTSFATVVSGTINVPSWADEALVTISFNCALYNSSAGTTTTQLKTIIDADAHSLVAGGLTNTYPTNYDTLTQSHSVTLTSLGSTISVSGQALSTTALPTSIFNQAFLTGSAVFRSIA